MKVKASLVIALVLFTFAFLLPSLSLAQPRVGQRTGRLTLGADMGALLATADSTAFGLAFSGDYYVNQNVSVGPLLQIGLTDDYFQIGPTLQAKMTFDLPDMPLLKPQIQGGIGFIYSELERGGDVDDTSFLIPLGVGFEYMLARDMALGTTLLFNFTDLDVRDENFFVSLLVGLRVRF